MRLHPGDQDFFFGTFLPERRASERPMAIACLGFVTLFPVPVFSLPRLNSCISLWTFLPADGEYLRPEDFFDEDFRLELLDFLPLEPFLALLLLRELELFFALLLLREADLFFALLPRELVLLRALLFFALDFLAVFFLPLVDLRALLLFVPDDFFALLDFFLADFFVAMTILPRTQMLSPFETVVRKRSNLF